MPCFRPVQFQRMARKSPESGRYLFRLGGGGERGGKLRGSMLNGEWYPDHAGALLSDWNALMPCGQCIGCRRSRVNEWVARCYAESKVHPVSCFVTLTYDEEHVPRTASGALTLRRRDVQLFMMRLRKYLSVHEPGVKVRFYGVGEYGSKTARPHYHLILFGWWPPRARKGPPGKSGEPQWMSEVLTKLWGLGSKVTFGTVTAKSIGYCTAYATKATPRASEAAGLVPEFSMMSLRPAIGLRALEVFGDQWMAHGHLRVDGRKYGMPRYFSRRLRELKPGAWLAFDRKRRVELNKRRAAGEFSQEVLDRKYEVARLRLAAASRDGVDAAVLREGLASGKTF